MSDNMKNIEQLKQWVKERYEEGITIAKLSGRIKARYEHILENSYKRKINIRDFIYSVILNEELICSECGDIRRYHYNLKRLTCRTSCSASLKRYRDSMEKKHGVEHPMKSQKIQEKMKNTVKKKYGTEYVINNKQIRKKIENTFLKNYGYTTPAKAEEIKEKIKQTNLRKYGVENVFQSEIIKEKIKQTNLQKYGVCNPAKSIEIQNKIKQTNLQKYGLEYNLKSDAIREKIKQTNLQKYDAETPLKSKQIQEKIKKTNLRKYGYEYPFQSDFIQKKIKETYLKKYGTNPSRKHYSETAFKFVENREFARQIIEEYKTLKRIAEYLNISTHTVANTAKKFGLFDLIELKPSSSFFEEKIYEFIREFYDGEIIRNTRKIISPYEIDIYIPEFRLGVEFHGLFYHSELFCEKDYHYKKFIRAKEHNIKLLQIFEDEWNKKKPICENIIKNHFNSVNMIIPARKCRVEEIDNRKYKQFLEKNHIQGYTNARYKYGLWYDNDLISVISFSPSRAGIGKMNKNDYELVRYAIKGNIRVIGGFEKLLKHFIRIICPTTIYTYVDNRFFDGHSLKRAGFEFVDYGKPSYWYVPPDKNIRLHRFGFTKRRLINKFGHLFENINELTEYQIMQELGYLRIYDAGHSKWVYHV